MGLKLKHRSTNVRWNVSWRCQHLLAMKITMLTRIKEANKVSAKSSTSGSDLVHFICFLLTFWFFYCCLATLFLLNRIKESKMPQIKGGKVVYIGLEAGGMVCMNSDSEGDDVDLAVSWQVLQDICWLYKVTLNEDSLKPYFPTAICMFFIPNKLLLETR